MKMLPALKANARVQSEIAALSRASMAFLVALALAVLFAQMRGQAQFGDALPYAKGYLVTGDYVVAGVDIMSKTAANGSVTGTISMSGVPDSADIIAAYLYWETIWTNRSQLTGFTFRGQPITVVK